MKTRCLILIVPLLVITFGCSKQAAENTAAKPSQTPSNTAAAPTPAPSITTPKNGDYNGKGVVTKLNLNQGSVELNHEAVKDMMPAMQMEFFVTDKKMLQRLKLGDNVDFVIRYKDYNETIVSIKKAQ